MKDSPKTSLTDRLHAAAAAKAELLAKFKSKPSVTNPDHAQRDEARAAELRAVRRDRSESRASKKQASDASALIKADEAAALARAGEGADEAAKLKRDAKYAARKARR
ncbi:MAG: hypothetical protein JWO33_596 [Caulobacteraceae bacterium]|nr:hypothetical protein [Caulobacteraceae bacterium]